MTPNRATILPEIPHPDTLTVQPRSFVAGRFGRNLPRTIVHNQGTALWTAPPGKRVREAFCAPRRSNRRKIARPGYRTVHIWVALFPSGWERDPVSKGCASALQLPPRPRLASGPIGPPQSLGPECLTPVRSHLSPPVVPASPVSATVAGHTSRGWM
jgi:hypothetical protein